MPARESEPSHRGSLSEALRRRRNHQLIDLLLGLWVLLFVVGLIAQLSPILATAIVAVAAVGYGVNLHTQEQIRKKLATRGPAIAHATPLDELEAKLADADQIPLTQQIRIERAGIAELMDRIALTADSLRARAVTEGLARLIHDAPPVPLTGQVRFDRDEATRLLVELREALQTS